MPDVAEMVARVHGATRGAKVVAAFDDRALVGGDGRFPAGSAERWAGHADTEVAALAVRLFREELAAHLHREVYEVLEAHRAMGHTLVVLSSGLRHQADPLAQALGVDHVISTAAEVDAEGRLTGRTHGPPMDGPGKARALVLLADRLGADLERSFAYATSGADLPVLEIVGAPSAVEPDDGMRDATQRHGWPVLRCAPTGTRPGPVDIARTAAFYGGFFTAMGAGLGVGLLHRSRRAFLDVALGVGSELSLALAGVRVDVVKGAENLWTARPAVFVFNHTSKMDAFVVMKLLREDFTGVAKAETKKVPVFGQLFRAADMAFVDRTDRTQAVDALRPVVEKLRAGTSIVISPEGTRTPTPRLGPFKKGPFHIAMQAGVPIVPMLFRGVDEVQWRGAQTVRPGRVEVVVLPPVDTSRWRPETVAEHRDEVRGLMAATLAAWPTSPRPALAQETIA